MDPSRRPPATGQHPPPTSSSTSAATFPVQAITTFGILTTAILLVSYYVFVIKCWRGSGILRRVLSSAYSRRRGRRYIPPVVHTMATEVRGLEPSVIRAIPIIKYTKASGDQRPFFHECAVCLSEFQEGERLKLLPNCSHGFHIDCVDTWLQFNARCPLCRSEVRSTAHLTTDHVVVLPHRQDQLGENMVAEVRDEVSNQTPGATAAAPSPSTRKKGRKHLKAGSVGDECIDVRVEKEEQFHVQLVRRSVSMDSSNDRQQLYQSVQEILRQNPHHLQEAGSSSSGRIQRRPFFSFIWSTRSSALSVKIDA